MVWQQDVGPAASHCHKLPLSERSWYLLPAKLVIVMPGFLHVQFDLTFPHMPCAWLSLDAMDISGEMHLDVVSSGPAV